MSGKLEDAHEEIRIVKESKSLPITLTCSIWLIRRGKCDWSCWFWKTGYCLFITSSLQQPMGIVDVMCWIGIGLAKISLNKESNCQRCGKHQRDEGDRHSQTFSATNCWLGLWRPLDKLQRHCPWTWRNISSLMYPPPCRTYFCLAKFHSCRAQHQSSLWFRYLASLDSVQSWRHMFAVRDLMAHSKSFYLAE